MKFINTYFHSISFTIFFIAILEAVIWNAALVESSQKIENEDLAEYYERELQNLKFASIERQTVSFEENVDEEQYFQEQQILEEKKQSLIVDGINNYHEKIKISPQHYHINVCGIFLFKLQF